jgi:hypothetical protein
LGKEKIVSRRHHGQATMDADSSTARCMCTPAARWAHAFPRATRLAFEQNV